MGKKSFNLLLVLTFLFVPAFLFSQVDTAWVRRYNGLGNSYDYAYALAIDNLGNVYITGKSLGSGTDYDYCTIKYDANGNVVWVRRYNGPGNGADVAYALAVDNSGNVYVAGESYGLGTYSDFCTIKYDANGNELWVRRYNGSADTVDVANALAVDNQGNVYVTGKSYSYSTHWDYCTIKYDSSGRELWVREYNGSGNYWDEARAIAVDNSGNLYVTGYSYGSGTYWDYCTIKYDATGRELWVKEYNGPAISFPFDKAYALALDNNKNVCLTGFSAGSGTAVDYCTIKYNKDGDQLWISRYNAPTNSDDVAYALAIDNLNNVYVTGKSWGSNTNIDYCTVKYDSNGRELWVTRYNGPGNYFDEALAIAIDNFGNVCVTGYSYGSGTSSDYSSIKYDSNGRELWVRRYNGPGNGADVAYALAVDNSGNVYVTGWSYGGESTSYDYTTIKYIQEQPALDEGKLAKIVKPISKKTNKIYDITGKIVKEKLKKGIYFKITEKGKEKILILK